MNLPITFSNEKYTCPNPRCKNKDFHYEDVCRNWVCPDCNLPLELTAEVEGRRIVIKRKKASQVNQGDLLILHGQLTPNLVLKVEREEGGIIRLAIKDYTVVKWEGSYFLNTVEGSFE